MEKEAAQATILQSRCALSAYKLPITLFDLAITEQIFPPTFGGYRVLVSFFLFSVSFRFVCFFLPRTKLAPRGKLITSYEIRTLPLVPGS